MALHLVVAHQTAASPELIDKLHEIAAPDSGARFVLLVPATPVRHLWTWTEGNARDNAERNAEDAALALRRNGLIVAETSVGAADPLEAIRTELARSREPFQTIVVSTLPPGISRWLRQDLPDQVRSKLGRDVIAVVAGPRPRRQPAATRGANALTVEEQERWQHPTLQTLAPLRGSDLSCSDGVVGRITEILYDYATLEPVWLGVASHPLPFRTLLVPAQSARYESGHLTVPLQRDRIYRQPHVDIGEGIPSITDEHRVYDYFGVPYQEVRDTRVLHLTDQVPGSERFINAAYYD
jgi:hypothetical protein